MEYNMIIVKKILLTIEYSAVWLAPKYFDMKKLSAEIKIIDNACETKK